MALGRPDWDVAKVTRDMLRDPLNNGDSTFGDATSITNIPDDRVLLKNTEAGKGVTYTEEYILVSEVTERDKQWKYLGLTGYDATAAAFVEAATPVSRDRRENIWTEFEEITETHRKRSASSGTPGNWDTLAVDGASVNDDAFNWWAIEAAFMYDAPSRSIQ